MSLLDRVNSADDIADFETGLVKPGRYHLEVVSFEEKKTANDKEYIEIESVIHGPSYSGKHIWHRFWVTTPKATEISKAQLRAISGEKVIGNIAGKHYYADIFIEDGRPKNDGSGENWPNQNRQRRFKAYSVEEPVVAKAETLAADEWDAL